MDKTETYLFRKSGEEIHKNEGGKMRTSENVHANRTLRLSPLSKDVHCTDRMRILWFIVNMLCT